MTWVITRLCRDCVDMACVEPCPVGCILQYQGGEDGKYENQLYIDPDDCIDCGACEPMCPWEAIYEDVSVPDVFKEDIELNAKILDDRDDFDIPDIDEKSPPSPDAVEDNKKKWGLA